MIVLSLEKMVQALKKHDIHPGDIVMYFIALMSTLLLGLSVFSFLPTLYYIVFGFMKSYLESEALPLPLILHVFDIWHLWFSLVMVVLVVLGILLCFKTNYDGDNKSFVMRFICLNWPLTVRIITITGFLFLGSMLLIAIKYIPELKQLTEQSAIHESSNQSITPLNVIKKLLKRTEVFSSLVGKITLLQEATLVFKRLSNVSFYMYCLTHLGALLSALWYFVIMRHSFKRIAYS